MSTSDLTIGSLCSGYGGLDEGVQAVLGGRVAWHCEYAAAPSKILAHHWPEIPNHHDLTTTDWANVEPVDVLTGGYPCQPFSHAGHRKGTKDERHIWPHIADAVRVLRPRLLCFENVAGHVSLGLDVVLGDLASLGYDARWGCLRASDVGAPHSRLRVFIVATDTHGERHGGGQDGRSVGRVDGTHEGQARQRQRSWPVAEHRGPAAAADAEGAGLQGQRQSGRGAAQQPGTDGGVGVLPHADGIGRFGQRDAPLDSGRQDPAVDRRGTGIEWGAYAPAVRRWERPTRPAPAPTVLNRNGRPQLNAAFAEWMMGLPAGHVTDVPGLSRTEQLKALGNGVVPQQAAAAYRALLTPVGARTTSAPTLTGSAA